MAGRATPTLRGTATIPMMPMRWRATLKQQGLTIIISEHRLHYLANLVDKMIVMEKGRIKHIYSAVEARKLSSEQMIRMGLRLMNVSSDISYRLSPNSQTLLKVSSLYFKRQKIRYSKILIWKFHQEK